MYKDHSFKAIDDILKQSQEAFNQYKKVSLKKRADFMRAIAKEIELVSAKLIEVAHRETNLSKTRLASEIKRTIFQLTSYADAAEQGTWLEARLDIGNPSATPPKPDLRKMLVPIGPVVVFGASNFPFAYSTAGGDTACAFAAGCSVIVKAHPAHIQTSTLVAEAIYQAVVSTNMPNGVFAHIYGANFKVGEYLAKHDVVKAIGFTGSFGGGKALFDIANQRKSPIPVFAEMGSTNPVFLLADKLATSHKILADQMAVSITQDMGQFCTNPGVMVAVKSSSLDLYLQQLLQQLSCVATHKMLHKGIADNFNSNLQSAINQNHVEVLFKGASDASDGAIIIAQVPAKHFIKNAKLHEEVFGPYSILVVCNNEDELLAVAQSLNGQLTATVMATAKDVESNIELIDVLQEKCGRFVLNSVPTGVDVALAMHHSGPFPSCTDSRFTAVGADGIKRFARPVAFQNWDNEFLPDELKDENPLKIWRTVNNQLVK